jgi:hypothetical protein
VLQILDIGHNKTFFLAAQAIGVTLWDHVQDFLKNLQLDFQSVFI